MLPVSITEALKAMAFCHVAKLADTVQNEAFKELCLTMPMLRKLNASIRTASAADLRSIEGGKRRCLARPRADRRDLGLTALPGARLTFRLR